MASDPHTPAIEEVACNLCGSTARRTIVVEKGFPICRCEGCSLIYVSPRPVSFGGVDYWRNRNAGVTTKPSFEPVKAEVFDHGLDALEARAPEQGRLLDVGCGFGIFLERARQRDWDVYGCDVAVAAVEYARSAKGLDNVICGDLASAAYPSAWFQVATMWNVIDVIADPLATLRELYRVMAPGGVAMVRVSNMAFHDLAWKVRPLLRTRGRRFRYLAGVSPPTRLYGFAAGPLYAMMIKSGFESVEVEPAFHYRGDRARVVGFVESATGLVHRASRGRAIVSPTIVAWGRVPRR